MLMEEQIKQRMVDSFDPDEVCELFDITTDELWEAFKDEWFEDIPYLYEVLGEEYDGE